MIEGNRYRGAPCKRRFYERIDILGSSPGLVDSYCVMSPHVDSFHIVSTRVVPLWFAVEELVGVLLANAGASGAPMDSTPYISRSTGQGQPPA